jgi:hypothetical protein
VWKGQAGLLHDGLKDTRQVCRLHSPTKLNLGGSFVVIFPLRFWTPKPPEEEDHEQG